MGYRFFTKLVKGTENSCELRYLGRHESIIFNKEKKEGTKLILNFR